VHDGLQREVLIAGEVAGDLLAMGPRCDERVPVERGVAVQERDGKVVLVEDMVGEVGVPRQQLADEAAVAEARAQRLEVDTASSGQP
jgi:hypothetical protein